MPDTTPETRTANYERVRSLRDFARLLESAFDSCKGASDLRDCAYCIESLDGQIAAALAAKEAAERERDEARACITRYGDAGALEALQASNSRAAALETVLLTIMEECGIKDVPYGDLPGELKERLARLPSGEGR